MQRGVLVFMLFTLCCIGLFGLFGGCNTGTDTSKKLGKSHRDEKENRELFNPTSDKPAYEGFNTVRYESTIKGYKNRSELNLYFKDTALCEIRKTPDSSLHQLFADYTVDGDTILFDFKRDIKKKKNITFTELKELVIWQVEGWINECNAELNNPDTPEERKNKLKSDIERYKKELEKMKSGEYDEMCKNISTNLRRQMEELEKINPIKATVTADKSKIVLERFVTINALDGTKKELENIELLKE